MSALDGLFGIRRLFAGGVEKKLRTSLDIVGGATVTERTDYDADGKPYPVTELVVAAGAPGPAGPPGPAGEGTDPTAGVSTFTGANTAKLLDELTLTADHYYVIKCQAVCLLRSGTVGARMREFELRVCVNMNGGTAVLESPARGDYVPTGVGKVVFQVTGAKIQAWVYGASADVEWGAGLSKEIDRSADDQLPIGWNPLSEASCIAAFDASLATVNGSNNVTAWTGQIGSVTAAPVGTLPYVAARPSLNNQPAVYLAHTAAGEKFNVSNLTHAASDYSIFFAGDQEAPLDNDGYVFDCQTGRLCCATDRNGTAIQFNDGTFKGVGASAVTGPQYVSWILNSGTNAAEIWKNGTKISTPGSLSYTQVAIGGPVRLASQYNGTTGGLWKGWYHGLWIFNSNDPVIRYRMHLWLKGRLGF